jgi:hypothetical protein
VSGLFTARCRAGARASHHIQQSGLRPETAGGERKLIPQARIADWRILAQDALDA